jgi:hypothetical protein
MRAWARNTASIQLAMLLVGIDTAVGISSFVIA